MNMNHISSNKQEELDKVVKIIKEVSNDISPVEMIILFWSYARWDQVERDIVKEWNATLEFKSDFDLLLITKQITYEKNIALSRVIKQKIQEDKTITTPVSLIIEDIKHINDKLEENRYFYLDIKKEWIVLYDSEKFKLWDSSDLTLEKKLELQKEDFSIWFTWGKEFLIDYKNAHDRWSYNIAVFYLHQAAEKFITSYMLVKTWYKPKTHDLDVLYKNLKDISQDFDFWFSLEKESSYFELLRMAYLDARYNKDFKITRQELEYLHKKVIILEDLIEDLCKKEMWEK